MSTKVSERDGWITMPTKRSSYACANAIAIGSIWSWRTLKRIIRIHQKNQGKGGAIYSGWDTAELDDFKWVAFVDADGAISSQETLRFLSLATQDNANKRKCLWSIRVKGQGKDIQRTPIRNFLGNVFRIIVKCLFNIPVKDTQCGLKCIPLKAYHEIRNRLTERRFVFDVELASLLIRKKYQLEQVAIDWQESPGSTVKISSAFRMAASLLVIRLRLFLGNNN